MIYLVGILCLFIIGMSTYFLSIQDKKINDVKDKYNKLLQSYIILENNINDGYTQIITSINKCNAYNEYLYMRIEEIDQCIKEGDDYISFSSDIDYTDTGSGGPN